MAILATIVAAAAPERFDGSLDYTDLAEESGTALGELIFSIKQLAGVPRRRLCMTESEIGAILAADLAVAGKKMYGQI